jgi:hypothetical protein
MSVKPVFIAFCIMLHAMSEDNPHHRLEYCEWILYMCNKKVLPCLILCTPENIYRAPLTEKIGHLHIFIPRIHHLIYGTFLKVHPI